MPARNEQQKTIDHSWQDLMYKLKPRFNRKPDIQSMLFLIGVQELGVISREFTKEEKQDLMHIAVCRLLCFNNVYEFDYRDDEGWPHFKQLKEHPKLSLTEQEYMFKDLILKYFKEKES